MAFDIGAYNGKDSITLRNNGYVVISVEANPIRFKQKIKPICYIYDEIIGENLCIGDRNAVVDFHLSKTHGVWDSCNIEIAERKQKSTSIKVQQTTVVSLIEKYGLPEYIKCDIEGNDIKMLKSLLTTNYRPRYISCESECQGNDYDENKKYDVINCMYELGYRKFHLVDCRDECGNTLTVMPRNITDWMSFKTCVEEMKNLTEMYETKYGTRQLWCDVYCSI